MTKEHDEVIGLRGVVISDIRGKCLAAIGVAEDMRIRAIISTREWLEEAAARRVTPILLNDAKYIAFVSRVGETYLVLLSEPPTETVLQFVSNVEFAFDIIDHILTDPYDAMAIVDKKANVAFISPVHEKYLGLQPGEAVGRNVRDVIENSRLHQVVKTGVAEVGQVHRMKGRDRIVSRHPIRRDGEIVGAIGRIMFKGPQQVEALARKINVLEKEIEIYKAKSTTSSASDKILDSIIGQSFAIQSVREQIRKIAPLDIPVLIQGESGTGKELVAQALHRLSSRQDGRLVTVNAAALPESLVESELFGYEAGSFTGADRKGRAGKFEQADKGTIFLDEIGDMPLEVQSKLLRVLQDRMVERVGGDKPKRVDFRLCSATNRDLESDVDQGKFRLDLFYRISPVCIYLPSLEERREDIPLLLNHFVTEIAAQYNRERPEVDYDVAQLLMQRSWPGNVRQLRHTVERAMVFAEGGKLTVEDFQRNSAPSFEKPAPARGKPAASTLQTSLDQFETRLINETISRFQGDRARAAEVLGVPLAYLDERLEQVS
ncbi:sigma-54 interaction domain-containing protein [Celeribacter indicus]|uniref:Nif-specific regulatory protein n=1 Tax=Celeribacter indicus TaxID=1208324 RepID=A0A0B5E1V8_9RHOB|nr:sigma 54-interacting transcriptional regulator [Celeribacter indicus]AJE49214.1 sigma-54 dependent transcription regulator [Celeribacter indicus]SDX51763.1 Transcriptional regulator containing PAS, AAA-type ATPase, and DNA-binding Fis domains [Celeribacter indicus]